jgi:arylsulfatase A-like enzyme
VYVHTAEPHHPYGAPEPFTTMFDPGYAGPVDALWKPRGEVDPRDLAHAVARYDGEVAYADHRLGELVDRMREAGLLAGALLVVTADHGEAFGEHGFYGHGGELHPELLRVPLVLWGPDHLRRAGSEPGRRVTDDVQLLDVMPTLVELFGLSAGMPMQGRSLVPFLAGREPSERSILSMVCASEPPRLALVRGRWKLDFDAADPGRPRFALFDLETDAEGNADLLAAEPEVARAMIAEMARAHAAAPPYDAGVSATYEISSEQLDGLRELGYLK